MKFMADSPHKKSKILCMSLHFRDFGVCVCVVFVFVEKPFFSIHQLNSTFYEFFFCEFRQNTFIWLLQYPFLSTARNTDSFFLIFHWLCPWVHAWNKESRVFLLEFIFFVCYCDNICANDKKLLKYSLNEIYYTHFDYSDNFDRHCFNYRNHWICKN